ncbi:uncharacterized protein LOC127871487 isoform X2 [Dreissena polymorpha]|uniref:uncharacterized protein LOC127871487 isoform X2 n=1 Tax=Dreissena polymorpha TaxID=45954 RepID=UPI002264DAF0|nr:uncharacterized protein LOC127871487 isoform X2 [Dreissena polymorpha]
MKMFSSVHKVDPNVQLFLNDYGIMEDTAAQSLRNQAMMFKSAGVPIHGIGIQSHLRDINVDITTMKARLDTVAEAVLPIWITELSIETTNETVKASVLRPNAAGLVYQELYKTTWRTNTTLPVHGNGDVTVRGFQGVYKVDYPRQPSSVRLQ